MMLPLTNLNAAATTPLEHHNVLCFSTLFRRLPLFPRLLVDERRDPDVSGFHGGVIRRDVGARARRESLFAALGAYEVN